MGKPLRVSVKACRTQQKCLFANHFFVISAGVYYWVRWYVRASACVYENKHSVRSKYVA